MRLQGSVQTRGVLRDAAFFLAVGALICLFAYPRVEGTRVGYELSRLQSEHNELLREQQALQLETATRRAPRHIEAVARGRLGMVDPDPDKILQISGAEAPRDAQARAGR
jgi:cell division protein FtsL